MKVAAAVEQIGLNTPVCQILHQDTISVIWCQIQHGECGEHSLLAVGIMLEKIRRHIFSTDPVCDISLKKMYGRMLRKLHKLHEDPNHDLFIRCFDSIDVLEYMITQRIPS